MRRRRVVVEDELLVVVPDDCCPASAADCADLHHCRLLVHLVVDADCGDGGSGGRGTARHRESKQPILHVSGQAKRCECRGHHEKGEVGLEARTNIPPTCKHSPRSAQQPLTQLSLVQCATTVGCEVSAVCVEAEAKWCEGGSGEGGCKPRAFDSGLVSCVLCEAEDCMNERTLSLVYARSRWVVAGLLCWIAVDAVWLHRSSWYGMLCCALHCWNGALSAMMYERAAAAAAHNRYATQLPLQPTQHTTAASYIPHSQSHHHICRCCCCSTPPPHAVNSLLLLAGATSSLQTTTVRRHTYHVTARHLSSSPCSDCPSSTRSLQAIAPAPTYLLCPVASVRAHRHISFHILTRKAQPVVVPALRRCDRVA